MKINLIIFLSEFNLGGAGNSVYRLCKGLPKKNYKITVICLKNCFYKLKLKKLNIKNSINCLITFKSNNILGLLVFFSLIFGKI